MGQTENISNHHSARLCLRNVNVHLIIRSLRVHAIVTLLVVSSCMIAVQTGQAMDNKRETTHTMRQNKQLHESTNHLSDISSRAKALHWEAIAATGSRNDSVSNTGWIRQNIRSLLSEKFSLILSYRSKNWKMYADEKNDADQTHAELIASTLDSLVQTEQTLITHEREFGFSGAIGNEFFNLLPPANMQQLRQMTSAFDNHYQLAGDAHSYPDGFFETLHTENDLGGIGYSHLNSLDAAPAVGNLAEVVGKTMLSHQLLRLDLLHTAIEDANIVMSDIAPNTSSQEKISEIVKSIAAEKDTVFQHLALTQELHEAATRQQQRIESKNQVAFLIPKLRQRDSDATVSVFSPRRNSSLSGEKEQNLGLITVNKPIPEYSRRLVNVGSLRVEIADNDKLAVSFQLEHENPDSMTPLLPGHSDLVTYAEFAEALLQRFVSTHSEDIGTDLASRILKANKRKLRQISGNLGDLPILEKGNSSNPYETQVNLLLKTVIHLRDLITQDNEIHY